LLRGGRLSRHIEIPVPDEPGRRKMLDLFTKTMPLDGVDLDALAERTDAFSGADLEALCQEAGMNALIRTGSASDDASVTAADFASALAARKGEGATTSPSRSPSDQQGYV
jgi:transitional endoplasmic reticulum ATPase